MEFDLASKRLQREQQRSKQTTMKKKVMSMSAPHHQTKEIQLQQKQQRQQLEEKRQKERQQKLYETQLLNAYMHKYDSKLHIQSLLLPPLLPSSTPVTPSAFKQPQHQQQQHLNLIPISIHGNGDKITLPPSMLERLLQIQEQSAMTNGSDNNSNTQQQQQQQPWTFRIGIRNPKSLTFPISDELQNYVQENFRKDIDDSMDEDEDDDDLDDDDDAMDIDGSNNYTTRNRHWKKKQFLNDMTFYMNELQQHQYISYTHGTVIEFTQEEGYIGIPKAIAHSLLSQSSSSTKINIETTRTVDPATAVKHVSEDINSDDTDIVIDNDVAVEEKTPGHVAYNAFDIPSLPIEIVLLQLPKGTGMTLRPIMNSNNSTTKSFYQLQQDQVKYALEQSIQRTRATITLHDTITTWYRGNEYQFLVTKLVSASFESSNKNGTPNLYNAVSCINTDIEIEFEPIHVEEGADDNNNNNHSTDVTATTTTNGTTRTTGTGRRLMDEPTATVNTQQNHSTSINKSNPSSTGATGDTILLPPEPPMEEKTNIITIQFRFNSHNSTTSGSPIQRRFDITTNTIRDLFDFVRWQQQQHSNDPTASSGTSTSPPQQQLVRRYPRRVFTNSDTNMTLQEAGFQSGNELLIVEEI